MVDQISDPTLTEILKATADPTRRRILTILVQDGPARVTDLAARFDMSLNAVSKHIKLLEKAGLVSRSTVWREHVISPEMAPLGAVDAWFSELRSTWEMRLERLSDILTEEKENDD